ncbi:cytokine receptor-like factor 3 [Haliotis rufescens]|uniref:cytokine receptor-like factor 3 n=1 Tax=Haliotis rufescens TaxID=6454 RepID=UPI00201EB96E|nr:cytokine receptor-like factor 3 [Haliotis rufescens]XP_046361567.2 cytokine receptor-like factor 3 [Haliotis rufescens]
MSGELLHSVVEILDSAHQHRYQLSELLASLGELKHQVQQSADNSRNKLKAHFDELKTVLNEALEARLSTLTQEIDSIEETAMTPLGQCEEMIQQGIDNAASVMEEGSLLLKNDPESNLAGIIKFKDNPHTKGLSSLPEIPCRSAVPDITVELRGPLKEKICNMVRREGKVAASAPVQITDLIERPGGLIVHWSEVDDDVDITEFCLQHAYGNIKYNDDANALWHTSYTGSDTQTIVKHLSTNKIYSFRICGRGDPKSAWSAWSLPTTGVTTVPHYQWNCESKAYSTSNEDKTATRITGSLTSVLYSGVPSISSGEQISFRILDSGEKSFDDGVGVSWMDDDADTLRRLGAVCVDTGGKVYVDGQEMKTKLSPIVKGSVLTIKTEPLPNGKVRVSVEANDKEVTFDWKAEAPQGGAAGFSATPMQGMPLSRQFSAHQLYFAMRFTHEDWKIAVE